MSFGSLMTEWTTYAEPLFRGLCKTFPCHQYRSWYHVRSQIAIASPQSKHSLFLKYAHVRRIWSVLELWGILFSADTIYQVIIHKACGLQVGITDGRSKEFKATFFHIFAHGVWFGSRGLDIFERFGLVLGKMIMCSCKSCQILSEWRWKVWHCW